MSIKISGPGLYRLYHTFRRFDGLSSTPGSLNHNVEVFKIGEGNLLDGLKNIVIMVIKNITTFIIVSMKS